MNAKKSMNTSSVNSRKRKHDAAEPISESWSRTEQYKVRGRHKWTIDDFLRRASCTEVGDSLCSPVFSVPVEAYGGETQELNFQLEVFPNGEEGEDNMDYVAVFLTSRRQEDLEVKYDFSVLKADGVCWGRIGNTFKKFSPEQNSWGYGKAFSKAKLMEKQVELLPEGKLTIVCNLEIYYSDRQASGKKERLDFGVTDAPSLGDNLSTAFTFSHSGGASNVSFADMTLVCKGKSFPCHKFMLAARSDVFAAMFSHPETLESKNNVVEVEDAEPEAIEQLLRFIYTDKAEAAELAENAAALLPLADKYNLPRLKAICEESICEDIDVSNAVDLLILGHLHEAKNLKTLALEFVSTNLVKITETPSWTQITQGHQASLLSEILKNVMMKIKP